MNTDDEPGGQLSHPDGKTCRSVAGYARSLTADAQQVRHQIMRLNAFCMARFGLEPTVFTDIGPGGEHAPGIKALLRHCAAHPASIIVTTEARKIAPDAGKQLMVLTLTRSLGASWICTETGVTDIAPADGGPVDRRAGGRHHHFQPRGRKRPRALKERDRFSGYGVPRFR